MSSGKTSENELNIRINDLKELNKTLDQYEDLFSNLTKHNNIDYEALNENISPEERATLNWNLGYSIYSNYYRNYTF